MLKVARHFNHPCLNENQDLNPHLDQETSHDKHIIGKEEIKSKYSAFTLQRQPHPHLERFLDECSIPTLSSTLIPNAHVLTIFGDYVFDKNYLPIQGSFAHLDRHDAIQISCLLPCFFSRSKATSVLLIQSNMWWQNYFHWTLDYLTKIIWARRLLGRNHHLKILYMASRDTINYQAQSLLSLGIKKKDIKPHWHMGRLMHAKAESLLLIQERYDIQKINPTVHNNTIHPSIVNELADTVLGSLRLKQHKQPAKRIYLSRKNALSRRVTNEAEVQSFLATHGFTFINLEKLTYLQQVSLFANATVVIGVHGAGLTNITYSQSCSVLEIFASEHRHGAEYLQLTNIRNGFYSYHSLPAINAANDIYIPIDLLSEYVAILLSQDVYRKN